MTYHDRRADWFLAQVKPNSHRIADRNLQRQGFRTFLPLLEQTRRRQGMFTPCVTPLFPGYLFVAFDSLKSGWRAVNSTHGIAKLVSFGADPTPVQPELISNLISRCDQNGRLVPARSPRAGDVVEILGGPFAEFAATVESIAPDKRGWILLDIMGRPSRVAVDADTVRSV